MISPVVTLIDFVVDFVELKLIISIMNSQWRKKKLSNKKQTSLSMLALLLSTLCTSNLTGLSWSSTSVFTTTDSGVETSGKSPSAWSSCISGTTVSVSTTTSFDDVITSSEEQSKSTGLDLDIFQGWLQRMTGHSIAMLKLSLVFKK